MKKFKCLWRAVALAAIVFCFVLFMGNVPVSVSAEEVVEPPVEEITQPEDEETDDALSGLVEGFLASLREKYGEDYQTYYNAILEKWGSVEEYLLSLANEQDEAEDGWISFVNWLGEYAPIWGSILAVALLIIAILFGKKSLRKIADWVTGNSKNFKNLYNAFNTLYLSTKAQNEALLKLLGENERFQNEREALKKAIEEIDRDAEI